MSAINPYSWDFFEEMAQEVRDPKYQPLSPRLLPPSLQNLPSFLSSNGPWGWTAGEEAEWAINQSPPPQFLKLRPFPDFVRIPQTTHEIPNPHVAFETPGPNVEPTAPKLPHLSLQSMMQEWNYKEQQKTSGFVRAALKAGFPLQVIYEVLDINNLLLRRTLEKNGVAANAPDIQMDAKQFRRKLQRMYAAHLRQNGNKHLLWGDLKGGWKYVEGDLFFRAPSELPNNLDAILETQNYQGLAQAALQAGYPEEVLIDVFENWPGGYDIYEKGLQGVLPSGRRPENERTFIPNVLQTFRSKLSTAFFQFTKETKALLVKSADGAIIGYRFETKESR